MANDFVSLLYNELQEKINNTKNKLKALVLKQEMIQFFIDIYQFVEVNCLPMKNLVQDPNSLEAVEQKIVLFNQCKAKMQQDLQAVIVKIEWFQASLDDMLEMMETINEDI